ncbi:MAG: class I SAM-dependent methyltransferase [Candidatus Spechtbacterales bacterium]
MVKSVITQQDKWEEYARIIDTKTSSKSATFTLTVEHTLQLLGDKREGIVLDVGCGFGEIDILLAKMSNFKIIGCDVSKICVEKARGNVKSSGMGGRIKIEEGSVYALPYPDEYFDVVVSFGYASAATYKGAQDEVRRVLKPGGLLVCDFINLLSVYKIMNAPARWKRLTREEGKHYNTLTMRGIREYFQRYNLKLISQRLFNTYPPMNFLPPQSLIFFDKTIGRVASYVLGRVRIVCFQKI